MNPNSHLGDGHSPNWAQTRWSLLSRLKDWGDEKSWQDFFNTYWRLIYLMAKQAGLKDFEAEEVVQETVISVAQQMPQFKCRPDAGSFKSWLLVITRRRITDQLRKRPAQAAGIPSRGHEDARTDTVERIPDRTGIDLEKTWDREWEEHLTRTALERVRQKADPEQYQMFDLHLIQKLPAREVARKLRIKMARVYFAKYKICRLLRKEIKQLRQEIPQ